ncbi:fructosamine kinase family protein [Vaginella massiliensis]|uniref:fructosamine kinase family protein n=1 Tax=Vaginella massiliensis TaxID=1816680 RepID=UPI001F205465|nr:fructosamine kinase family protein [Vaginella massiliensis]
MQKKSDVYRTFIVFVMNEILKKIASSPLQFDEAFPVEGGDINDAFRLEKDGHYYFLKLNIADSFPEMFRKEAYSLDFLGKINDLKIPKTIAVGISEDNYQYLILEWIEKVTPTPRSWQNLGQDLAKIHRQTHETFGWQEDNYIGIIVQNNAPKTKWSDFYAENRLLPLTKMLFDEKLITNKDAQLTEQICKRLDEIFPNEAPALLHGDLWNGNILPTHQDRVAFIDPACYFGHREMDIAMTKLFSGFDENFYASYQEHYPLEQKWEERIPYAQLFPLMIHALLFKGYYINEVQNMLKKL